VIIGNALFRSGAFSSGDSASYVIRGQSLPEEKTQKPRNPMLRMASRPVFAPKKLFHVGFTKTLASRGISGSYVIPGQTPMDQTASKTRNPMLRMASSPVLAEKKLFHVTFTKTLASRGIFTPVLGGCHE
jgi:hypothetical protein